MIKVRSQKVNSVLNSSFSYLAFYWLFLENIIEWFAVLLGFDEREFTEAGGGTLTLFTN
jgi:hypothetical protein